MANRTLAPARGVTGDAGFVALRPDALVLSYRMKRLFLTLIYRTGALWLWRYLHRHHITILMVHGVMDTEDPTPWVPLRPQLSRRTLEGTLRRLSKYYRFVSLEDAVAMLSGKRIMQPHSVVLTFDDGYRNNLTHALPILRRYQVPAAFFIATGHIDQRKPFWFDRLDYALQYAAVDGRQVMIGKTTISLQAYNRHALQRSYKGLRDAAKGIDRPDHEMVRELENLAASLERECGRKLADVFADDDWSALLTWQEMKSHVEHDITFGSHTVDHVRLGLVDDETSSAQLMQSKEVIQQQLGHPCRYLCYPSGSFTPQVARRAQECGYEAALTSEDGTNKVGDDPMTLRRLTFPETGNERELLSEVSGFSLFVSQWVGYARRVMRR